MLSCEHGGNEVPARFARLFRSEKKLLASHRGWDPGALALAKSLARETGAPLHAVTTTRLLIECNRSPGNPARFSKLARALPESDRAWLDSHVWQPHHAALTRTLAAALMKGPVLHVGVHSFTPTLGGKARTADVALLYDPASKLERAFAQKWLAALKALAPELRLRRNYPYKGTSDGMTRLLRRKLARRPYAGIELEVNQALLADSSRARRLARVLAQSLPAR